MRPPLDLLLLAGAIGAGAFVLANRAAPFARPGSPALPDWPGPAAAAPRYPWRTGSWEVASALYRRFPAPEGSARPQVDPGGFAEWLRCLPLLPGRGTVRYPSGNPKPDQSSHAAVLDLDTGPGDLQQCADTILRLRAEYLWSTGDLDGLAFHFTSGDLCRWSDWASGVRPRVSGNHVEWVRSAEPDDSRASFLDWLRVVFTYAGTISTRREMATVASWTELAAGDVLVRAGSPGHAVIVVDVAERPGGLERAVLLAQGYMPAQCPHVLARPGTDGEDAWFPLPDGGTLEVAGWEFGEEDLRRFAD